MIARDVTRTFTIFNSSDTSVSLHEQQRPLYAVLNAVAEADDGYCQGMNFIAAVFLVEGYSEEDAYVAFMFALQMRHLSRVFNASSSFLNDYILQFDMILAQKLPKLDQHMKKLGFHPVMYCIEWFTTMVSARHRTARCPPGSS